MRKSYSVSEGVKDVSINIRFLQVVATLFFFTSIFSPAAHSLQLDNGHYTLAPPALSFNEQLLDTVSGVKKVTIRNTGNGPLVIASISKSGRNPGQFSETTTCPIGGDGLAVGASCIVSVKFKPTTAGAKSASVVISASAPVGNQTVSLSGTGLGPNARVSPASLTFADQASNTISAPKTVTVYSTGSLPLVITGIGKSGANAGQFSQTSNCPTGGAGLAVGASCTIKVKFKPTMVGRKSASLAINIESPAVIMTVALSGRAMP